MNQAYRLVWSAARGAYVIAPETARGRGKSGGTLMVGALVALFGLALHGTAQAQQPPAAPNVVPTSAATQAYVSPNGVTVVNIGTANAAGVSHNKFHRYDVDARGLVLNNNGNPNVAAMESQLAGQVYTNTRLGREAGVILNEVVSPNRSVLAGFTEVLGKKADVIVANPYGITCTGCGFINTDRATLTTGTPVWKADGRVAGFNVAGGDVLINGGGLNASGQALLDIVTRTVKVDGQVNGNDIVLATGAHAWKYETREVTGRIAPSGGKPEYAIDTTALGGMYANRIHMIATDAGVGVRMLGEAAARTDDFRVDASGQLVLRGALSAGRDLVMRAAQLEAGSDQPAIRFAKRNIDIGASGSAAFDGGAWLAGGTLDVQAGTLSAVGGTQFYSGTDASAASRAMRFGTGGAMTFANARLASEGGMDLAAGGELQFGQDANVQAAGDIALRAQGRLGNNGTLIAARGMTATVGQAPGGGTPLLVNSGLLQASAGALALGAPGSALVIDNRARLLGGGISLYGDRLVNRGWIQSDSDMLSVQAGAIDNERDGVLLGAGKGDALRLSGATLNNDGVVQSAGRIDIATQTLARNAGKLIATDSAHGGANGDITINAHRIDNGGVIDAAGAGRFDAGYSMANAGEVRAGGISLSAFELDNRGTLYSRTDLAAGPRRQLDIRNHAGGQIVANGKLAIDGSTLQNSGLMQAGDDLQINLLGGMVNNVDGRMLADRGSLMLRAYFLDNPGVMQAARNLDALVADNLDNKGRLQTMDDSGTLRLEGRSVSNQGTVEAANRALIRSTGAGPDAIIANSNLVQAQGDLDLDSAVAIYNSSANSRILGNRAVSIDSRNGRTNVINHGRIQAAGMLAIGDGQQAGRIDNAISGTLLGQDMAIAADRLENAGAMSAGRATVRVASLLNKHAGSSIVMGDGGAFFVAGLLENRGAMHGNGEVMVRAGDIRNGQTGGISASGPLWLGATNNGIANAGALYSGSLLTLGARQSIDNSGTMDATDIAATAASIVNTRSIVAANNITIRASQEFRNLPAGGMPNLVYTNTSSMEQSPPTNGGSLLDPTLISISKYTDTITSSLPDGTTVLPGRIVAGKELRLNYGGRAENKASVLSADSRVIVAEPGAQAFDNSNLQMSRVDAVRTIKTVGHTNTGKAEYYYPASTYEIAAGPSAYIGYATDFNVALENSLRTISERPQGPSYDASIRATTLVFEGGKLVNSGNPLPAQPQPVSVGGAAAEDVIRGAGQAAVVLPGGNQGAAKPAPFAGLDLSLPANPNGYFVISRDPGTRYLVETNPRFLLTGGVDSRTGQGGNTTDGIIGGSDYLAMELGFDPERMQKRLGDAAYEQRLIQQQLIAQTGRHLLAGKRNEAAQMQGLFESAAGQASKLGLRFGVALGEEQINALDRDIVWMVEQEVRGEKVLAPVVYLSRASREGVERGTVIAADDVTMQVASLDNRGGVIAGRDKLTVRATDDVRNTSGTIKGGSLDLQSAAGDIVNATLAEGSGDRYQTRTVIGKTARIESTGDMRLDAGRNIAVKGAQVQAGGNASLRAGGSLEVDAVADRRADATSASMGMVTGLDRQGWSSSIATTMHQGASIKTGGALDASSAGDMRIAGSKVHAGGDLLLRAGGDLTVAGRDDTMTIRNSVTTSAAGIGGGLSGTQTVIVEKDRSRNLASTVSSDGKAVVVADKDVLIQGSSVAARDKLIVAGDAVTVAAARDSDRSSTTVSTVSLLKADASGKASASASADGRASVIDQQRVEALKMVDGELVQDARGGAGSKNENSLSGKRSFATSSTMDEKGKSEIKSESVRKDETIALKERSNEGERPVSVKPGRGTGAAAGSGKTGAAIASGEASSRSTAEAGASGNASAAASASGKAGVKLVENIVEKEEQSSERLARSTLSGSDVSLLAKQDAMLEAATVRAARDLTLQGRNVRIGSGQDKTVASTTRQVTAAGVLVNSANTASAEASGSAKADAKVSHLARPQGHDGDANASASVEASVKVAAKSDNKVDLFRSNETTEAVTTIRQAGSDIEAGGRLAVTAGKDMLVEGSALKGKAAVNLDAARMDFAAADDSVTRSTSSTGIGAGLALLADGNAQASGKASVSVEAGGKLADRGLLDRDSAQASVAGAAAASASASADARGEAGLQAQYRHATEETRSTTAKVSRIVSGGGDVTRTATGEIRDVGTVIDAAGDFSQRASAINSLAARNTTSEKTVSDDHQGRLTAYAKAGAGVAATASAKGEAGVGYLGGNTLDGESASDTVKGTRAGASIGGQLQYEFAGTDKQSASSTAVAGSIKAGGKVLSDSAETTVFEGTQISAARGVDLAAQRMELKAAADTKTSTDKTTSASGKLAAGAGAGTSSAVEGELAGKLERKEDISDSAKARVVSINAGEALSVRAGGDLILEGSSLKAGGDAELKAGGKLTYGVAADTTSSTVARTVGEIALATGNNEHDSKASVKLKGGDDRTTSIESKAVVGKLDAGGNIRVEGAQAATLEGTRLSAGGDVDIGSQGKVTVAAARDVSDTVKRVISGEIELGNKQAENPEKKSGEQSYSAGITAAGSYEKIRTETAKTASITAGGSLASRSGGDSAFEGAALAAGGKVEMKAGGNLAIDAARDRYTSTAIDGSLKVGGDKGSQTAPDKKTSAPVTNRSQAGKASLEAAANHVDKSTSRAGSIAAGTAGVALNAGGNASLEGTAVKSGGDLAVAAGGDLTIGTARSTTRSAGASLGLGGSSKSNTVRTDKNASAQSLDLAAHSGNKETHGAARLDARGAVALSAGGKASLVNTEVKADASTGIRAASVEKRTVSNTNATINIGASVSRDKSGATKKKTAPKTAQPFKNAAPAKTGQPSAIRIGERPASPARVATANAAAGPADAASKADATVTRPRSDAQAAPRQQAGASGK